MLEALQSYYLTQTEPNKSCLLALRSIILDQDSFVTETLKYGMPCFTYKKKAFCYLWIDKKTNTPYILLVEGKLLTHPALEQGNRKRMKVLNLDPFLDLPVETIAVVLKEALALCK